MKTALKILILPIVLLMCSGAMVMTAIIDSPDLSYWRKYWKDAIGEIIDAI